VVTEDWLEFILRRGEELARRLVVTPTPPRTAAGRRDLDANLYAPQLALERVTRPAGRSPGRPPFRPGAPGSWATLEAGGLRLPRYWEILHATIVLRAGWLRIELHEFQDIFRHVSAHRQAEFFRGRGKERIVVCPCPD
jgi:hypothetical protein